MTTNPNIKPCCQDAGNLEVVGVVTNETMHETCRRCRVCGCRHFEAELAPGVIGLEGKA